MATARPKHSRLSVLIDRELAADLERYAGELGLSVSGAARFALRAQLGVARDPHDAVFREVRAEMTARVRRALETALAEIPVADVPGGKRRR